MAGAASGTGAGGCILNHSSMSGSVVYCLAVWRRQCVDDTEGEKREGRNERKWA